MLRNKLWVIFVVPVFLSTMLKSTATKYQPQDIPMETYMDVEQLAEQPEETRPIDDDFPIYMDISGLTKPSLYDNEQDALIKEQFQEQPDEEEDAASEPVSLGYFILTAYCSCPECCGEYAYSRPLDEYGNPIVYTASGAVASAGTTIAVDPSVIPYGTSVIIDGHTYIAQDTGGAIVGNRIDVYFDNHEEAWNFGYQEAEVFVNYGA